MEELVTGGEELWRLTLSHSPVGLTMVALDGRMIAVNHALCAMLGYDADTLRSMTFQQITHPDDLAVDLELLGETLAGTRTSYRIRKRYFHADGRIVWGDLSVALLRDDDGEPIHFISQILDVTAQHDYEARLEAANAYIDHQRRVAEAVNDSVGVGLVYIDRDGSYESMNRRHRDFMALAFPDGHHGTAGELGDVFHLDLVTPLTREEMPTRRAAQGEEFDDVRMWVGRDPATRRALSVSARSVLDQHGDLTGAALAYTDVTEFIRALEVKDAFVAAVSHELRTPLTSVLGHLEMLGDRPDLPPAAVEVLQVVERNAVRLRHLVSDLLDAAQMPRELQLAQASVDLEALVLEAIRAAHPTARSADIPLFAQVAPAEVVGDAQRIRQVVDNLVGNAVKYTDPGGSVWVSLQAVGDRAELAVTDTGIGIAEDELAMLGTRFFRGREAQGRAAAGTGLGLSIVQEIVAAHDGQLSVDSSPGVGSTFTVRLPLAGVLDGTSSIQVTDRPADT